MADKMGKDILVVTGFLLGGVLSGGFKACSLWRNGDT